MKYLYIPILALLFLASCTGHFEELNTNPNQPLETSPDYIFNYVIKEGAGEYGFQSSYNNTYIQRWIMHTSVVYGNSTMPPYTIFDQYRIQNLWEYYYSSLMMNIVILESMTDPEENEDPDLINKYHVARIWRAYCFHKVTDLWGDVPYTEAWKLIDGFNSSSIKPAYDTQQSIYEELIRLLGESSAALVDGEPFYSNDMLFDGDLDKWRRFANSLRLRLAVRSGDQATITEILDADMLISNNEQSASFTYIESQDLWNPYYEIHINSQNPTEPENTGTSTPKISELLLEQLRDDGDPRLEVYAQTTEYDNITYRGVPNLMNAILKENQAMGIGFYTTSYIGKYFSWNPTWTKPLLSYAETCFLRAEAAQRGWSSENAQDHYENGVTAAITMYGIHDTLASQFLEAGGAFENTLEQTMTQKWTSLFLNGWEAYTEYRRTGYPQLMKWELELDGLVIKKAEWVEVPREYVPGRLPYPDDEKDLNSANYESAKSAMGGDLYKQQLWFSELFGEIAYDGAY